MIGRLQDVIAACITGPGPGAIAGVRLSGTNAWKTASEVCLGWPASPVSHHAFHSELTVGGDALVLPFSAGRSYTGEESVEIFLHGSPAGVRALLESLSQAGARSALPGEFTQRALFNGRLDLAQAEGVKASVEAQTEAQSRLASHLRQGALSRQVQDIRSRLTGVLASIEASVDFSDEIGDLDGAAQAKSLEACLSDITRLMGQAASSRGIAQGWRIALIGRPNAGKSSLLNSVLQSDRAIVTPIPGTTRDTLEERAEIKGLPFLLIDTAGLRDQGDEIEKIGMERALAAAQACDILWIVYDGSQGWTDREEGLALSAQRPWLAVATRRDLGPVSGPGLPVACPTGEGLDSLFEETIRLLPPLAETPVLARHEPLLRQARDWTEEAKATLLSPLPPDLASVHLQSAIRSLGEITGEFTPPDVIERIFADFCIGK